MAADQRTPWYLSPQYKGKHLLLVEFIFEHRMQFVRALWRRMLWVERFDRFRIYRTFRSRYPVQGIHGDIGVRVTNLSDSEFPGGQIANFTIKHAGHDVAIKTAGEHVIEPLAAGASVNLWVANTTINIPGAIWISCDVAPNEGVAQTFQCSRDRHDEVAISPVNHWSHSDFVLPYSDFLQKRTNCLIVVLTIVTVVDAVLGLRNILKGIVIVGEMGLQLIGHLVWWVFDLALRLL